MLPKKFASFKACLTLFVVITPITLQAQEDCGQEEKKHILIEYGQKRLEVSQTCWHPSGIPTYPGHLLTVEIQNSGKKKQWQFESSSLNPEGWAATESPVVIQGFKNGELLFIQQYSGGASCCWSMLAFDLERLEFLSNSPSSQTTINYDYRSNFADSDCNIGIWATPITPTDERALAERILYCFNGKKFIPKK